jgi:hypothetical protein
MDEPTIQWYTDRHRALASAGHDPDGPPDLRAWRAHHSDLHPYETLRAELDARYAERYSEWRPYFYRWLDGPATERLETTAIASGAIRPLGFRYTGATN